MNATNKQVAVIARIMMDAWVKAEGAHPAVSATGTVNASYVATFADMARAVLDDPEARALLAGGDIGYSYWEYGVERGPFPTVNDGKPYVEWGASVGMTHRYEYTESTVHALAGGRQVWRRRRTKFTDVLGEPEKFDRG